jgi:hypothetical protein
MTPISFPLKLGLPPPQSLLEIQKTFQHINNSCITVLLLTLNSLVDRLLSVRDVLEGGKQLFARVSCIYSNVPGPPGAVWLMGRRLTRMQVIMPHPTSIFQALSYDGKVFCNINLDNRSASQLPGLRTAYVDAIRNFAAAYQVPMEEKEVDENEWGGKEAIFSGVPLPS